MDEYKALKYEDESNISNQDSFSKNILKVREIKADSFEDNLNISDIIEENNKICQENNQKKKNTFISNLGNQNIEKDFSEDLDNINEEEFGQRKISLCSSQSEEYNCNNNININTNINNSINNKQSEFINKKEKKKIKKEDLNNIPLPLFSCIYCSNDNIAFKHLLQESISNKYLFQASIYDIRYINKLIIYQPIIDKDDKNEKLLDIIIKNTEYIHQSYNKDNINDFFKSENYKDFCKKQFMNYKRYFTQKIEESIIKKKKDFYFKGINKIPKNSLNNRCLFNSTNSLINNCNALSGFVETIPINNNNNININIGKFNNTNSSNISLNFNSISLNNNETGNCIVKDNNLLVSIVENIENNIEGENEIEDKEEIMDFFEFDTQRKIRKENIKWENTYFDIWNPIISDDFDINDNEEESYNHIVKENFNFSSPNINIKQNLKYKNRIPNNKQIFNNFNNNLSNIKNDKLINKNNAGEISQKNYKLKVNLLNPSNKLKSKTSNNSFYNKEFKKINVSQMKSLGSTNNSSVINFDNENKLKNNIFNHLKDFYNNSQFAIHVNTIQINDNLKKIKENNSMMVNNSTSLKSRSILHRAINNQLKIFPRYFHYSSIFNTNKSSIKMNGDIDHKYNRKNFNSYSTSFNLNNNINDTSIVVSIGKYKKNKIRVFDQKNFKERNKKNNLKDNKSKKTKYISRKLNIYNTSNSYFNNKLTKTKSTSGNRLNATTLINGQAKIISTKILFKDLYDNKNFTINNKLKRSYQKINNSLKSKLEHKSFINKSIDKTSLVKLRNKKSEIGKLFNNNKKFKGNHTNDKINTNKLFSDRNRNLKLNKLGLSSNSKTNNKSYISNETKNISSKKHLILSSSYIFNHSKKKVEKNNIKKLINFN